MKNEEPISFAFKLKDGKETDIFNQIVITAPPGVSPGLPGKFEIYGGQTLQEAQEQTNLLQTFDIMESVTSDYHNGLFYTAFTFDWDPSLETFNNMKPIE